MTKKKKPIPDISEILDMFNESAKVVEEAYASFAIETPQKAREKKMLDTEEQEKKIEDILFRDFNTITLGDYINAAQVYNREMMGSKGTSPQEAAYFTLFAFEERLKRIVEHHTYIN